MRPFALVWLVAAACSQHAGAPAGGSDATGGGDAAGDAAPADAAGPTWETVQPVSNDGTVIVEDVTYRSDGYLIHAHLCRPSAAGAHPALVYNHGGFQGLAIDPEAARCTQTAQLGFVWLGSSYRGEDGSEGSVEVCLGEVTDVLEMVRIADAQPYVDAAHVVMYGGSHGGCITERAVQRGVPVVAAADLFGPTDWASLYAYWQTQGSSGIYPQLIAVMNQAVGGPPSTHADAYAQRSPLHFMADFPASVPLFVAQGAADTIVPPIQSCTLAQGIGLASYHDDGAGHELAAVPPGCEGTGVPSQSGQRPEPSWPGSRYLVVYDGLGHETQSAPAQTMIQDVATFLMAKLGAQP